MPNRTFASCSAFQTDEEIYVKLLILDSKKIAMGKVAETYYDENWVYDCKWGVK